MTTDPKHPEPVRRIPGDESRPVLPGIALCLSGGGYRAMLFHLGALWRLNDFGYLPRIDRVSSVSGGSITAATLGMNWNRLSFDHYGIAQKFEEQLVMPLRRLAGITIDIPSIVLGALFPGSISTMLGRAYAKYLLGDTTLQDLPDRPRFILNATNVQSGVLWRFSKPYMWDYRVGKIEQPSTHLATAVAASSAFPPFLSPVTMRFNDADFVPNTGQDLQQPPFTTRVVLTDGGVYDNLGLETAFKRFQTILVSDAGGALPPRPRPWRNWGLHTVRVLLLINNQVLSLRKRTLISSYVRGDRDGAYWGIQSHIADYGIDDALPCPPDATRRLANTPTRLARLRADVQKGLINWGYAICDAAIRRHVDPSVPAPKGFPYGDSLNGT